MVTKERVGQVAVVLALCLTATAADQLRREFKYTVGPNASVSINNQFGPVSVKPSGTNQVIVTAILHSDKVEVDNSQNGDRIDLRSHLLAGGNAQNGSVEFQVMVPSDARVAIHSTNGPLHAEQLQGDLALVGDTALIDVHDVANAHVQVNTLNGPIVLTNVSNGHVEISSVGGEVTLNSVTGPLVAVSSTSGRIHYNGDFGIGGDYRLTSHTGDIDAVIPEEASLDISAHSVRGDVENDFPFHPKSHLSLIPQKGRSFVGTAGRAASSVVLRTFSGKIRLKKR